MKTMAEVYVKSFVPHSDTAGYVHALQHPYCAPGMADQALGRMLQFSGRVLPPDDSAILPDLDAALQRWGQQMRVYDVGRLTGRLKALTAGVRETPTVVMDGEKHVGLPAARDALRGLSGGGGLREMAEERSSPITATTPSPSTSGGLPLEC